jgi:predicted outer membrane repeat protein
MGGAAYGSNSGVKFTNCTFDSDTAASGGAIFNTAKATSRFINCTFTSNVATVNGGAVCDSSTATTDSTKSTLTNCILWSNSAPQSPELQIGSYCFPTINNCIITGGYAGTGTIASLLTTDPKLGVLSNNGGPVPTCSIASDSPARDAGTTSVPAGVDISTDARGNARSDGKPDIGAYEAP